MEETAPLSTLIPKSILDVLHDDSEFDAVRHWLHGIPQFTSLLNAFEFLNQVVGFDARMKNTIVQAKYVSHFLLGTLDAVNNVQDHLRFSHFYHFQDAH